MSVVFIAGSLLQLRSLELLIVDNKSVRAGPGGSAVNNDYAIRAGRRFAESARPLNHTCVSSTPEEPPRSFIQVQKQPHNDATFVAAAASREERSNSVPPGW